METGEGIKKFRERLRFNTQTDLAKALGINPQNVSMWEAGKGFPSFQIAKELLKMGITVEELFGVEYNGIQQLDKTGTITGEPQQAIKKLADFEADLLRKMSDEFARFEDKLESMKNWKEVYKLEKEIERGDKVTDVEAKKQRLQELREQIEDEFTWSERFDARERIKVYEDEIESMEESIRHNLYEIPDRKQTILKLQKEIEDEMYSYVNKELWELIRKKIEIANNCFELAKKYLEKEYPEKKDIKEHFSMLVQHYSTLVDIEKELDSLDIEHLNDLNRFIAEKYKGWYFLAEEEENPHFDYTFYYVFEIFVNYCYQKKKKENYKEEYFDKAIEVMNNLDNKIHRKDINLIVYRTVFIEGLEKHGYSSRDTRELYRYMQIQKLEKTAMVVRGNL
jgi:DNA-binding XRE family transcriptional regulator